MAVICCPNVLMNIRQLTYPKCLCCVCQMVCCFMVVALYPGHRIAKILTLFASATSTPMKGITSWLIGRIFRKWKLKFSLRWKRLRPTDWRLSIPLLSMKKMHIVGQVPAGSFMKIMTMWPEIRKVIHWTCRVLCRKLPDGWLLSLPPAPLMRLPATLFQWMVNRKAISHWYPLIQIINIIPELLLQR